MNVNIITTEILARLRALPNRQTAAVRALRREYSKRLAPEPPKFIIALALELCAQPDFLPRFIGYELVHYHRAALRSLRPSDVQKLARGLDSWYSVDAFAPLLAGPAWREGQIPDALIHRWARSKDVWLRRAALVSTVALNNAARGGQGDAARTLVVCELLVADREDMVVKALSWALRELAKRDPKAVRAFVQKHESKLAARVKREVGNKLRTGVKNPKLTAKMRRMPR
jgi:3-methyladenine DNA glycosylase AlkD